MSATSSITASTSSTASVTPGSLLSGKAQSDAAYAITRGDQEKLLALLALTAPDAASKPLFDSVLFCEAIDTCHFDISHAMLDQALPFRTAGDLGGSLLQSVRASAHRPVEALAVVDRLLDAMRALGADECKSFASGGHFEGIYHTAISSTPQTDFDSDEEVMDEEGNWAPVVPRREKHSTRRSLRAFKEEFAPIFDSN